MTSRTCVSKSETRLHCIEWKIENFSIIAKNEDMSNDQFLDFEAGEVEGSGCPLKWKICLVKMDGEEFCLKFKLMSPPPVLGSVAFENEAKVFARAALWKGSKDSECFFDENNEDVDLNQEPKFREECGEFLSLRKFRDESLASATAVGFAVEDLFCGESYEKFLDKDGALVLTFWLEFFVMRDKVVTMKKSKVAISLEEFHAESEAEAKKALVAALGTSKEVPFKEVTMKSMDGKEIVAMWAVLAAQSPVFATMYTSKMSETETGIIQMKHISGKTLEVFFHFISTGTLLPDWEDDEVIVELVNAAAMYQFKDLLEFFDGILGSVCSERTVMKLLWLSQKLAMSKAAEDLLEWIKKNGQNSPEEFVKLWEPMMA